MASKLIDEALSALTVAGYWAERSKGAGPRGEADAHSALVLCRERGESANASREQMEAAEQHGAKLWAAGQRPKGACGSLAAFLDELQ
ncbi:hypothetical protein MUG78_17900 [Gordonia alkaliphila]|uniref:hypothetical protein n=1 Tax=Gordonia alkaliphila TaxID=1053547 RepID=UPI001FF1CBA3|nr:hypothetical protein [Gordonia alkaliphila]MCK0441276.1 hypothetical protein [Gordonia alkaliphila]